MHFREPPPPEGPDDDGAVPSPRELDAVESPAIVTYEHEWQTVLANLWTELRPRLAAGAGVGLLAATCLLCLGMFVSVLHGGFAWPFGGRGGGNGDAPMLASPTANPTVVAAAQTVQAVAAATAAATATATAEVVPWLATATPTASAPAQPTPTPTPSPTPDGYTVFGTLVLTNPSSTRTWSGVIQPTDALYHLWCANAPQTDGEFTVSVAPRSATELSCTVKHAPVSILPTHDFQAEWGNRGGLILDVDNPNPLTQQGG